MRACGSGGNSQAVAEFGRSLLAVLGLASAVVEQFGNESIAAAVWEVPLPVGFGFSSAPTALFDTGELVLHRLGSDPGGVEPVAVYCTRPVGAGGGLGWEVFKVDILESNTPTTNGSNPQPCPQRGDWPPPAPGQLTPKGRQRRPSGTGVGLGDVRPRREGSDDTIPKTPPPRQRYPGQGAGQRPPRTSSAPRRELSCGPTAEAQALGDQGPMTAWPKTPRRSIAPEAARSLLVQEQLRGSHLREELQLLQQSMPFDGTTTSARLLLPIARRKLSEPPCQAMRDSTASRDSADTEFEVSARCLDTCIQLAAQALQCKLAAAATVPNDEAVAKLEANILELVRSRSDELERVAALAPHIDPFDGQHLSMLEALAISREREVLCELVDVLLEGRDLAKEGELSVQAAALLKARRFALMKGEHRAAADLRDQGTAEAVVSALGQLVSEERNMHAELVATTEEMAAGIAGLGKNFSCGVAEGVQRENPNFSADRVSKRMSAELHVEQHKAQELRQQLKSAEIACAAANEEASAAAVGQVDQQRLVDASEFAALEREAALEEEASARESVMEQELAGRFRHELLSEAGAIRVRVAAETAALAAARAGRADTTRAVREVLREAVRYREEAEGYAAARAQLRAEMQQAASAADSASLVASLALPNSRAQLPARATDSPRSPPSARPVAGVQEALQTAEQRHREALAECLQASVRLAMERGRARAADTLLGKARTELAFAESRLAGWSEEG